MSSDGKDALATGAGILMLVVAIGIAGWLAVQVANGVGSWWQSITYVSPEEQAKRDAKAKAKADEWAKDPRNPKVAGQKCLDLGGIPDYSAWDGDVKACNKPGGGNIDIKQSVEVKQ